MRPRWPELATRIGVAALAVIVGLLLLEGATRLVFDRRGMQYDIEMWKYAKLIKQRSDIAAMAHEHAPNRRATLMGVDVRINSLGLRDREFSPAKPPDVHRVLVLGDSMTFGWGAAEEDAYPKKLERLLNRHGDRYEVINAGVGNYNSVQEVAYFLERGVRLQPDEVVLGFYINDAEPTPSPNTNLLARTSYAYVVASSLVQTLGRQMGLRPTVTQYYDALYADRQPGWEACREALVELSRVCRKLQIPLWIALIPELHAPNKDYPFKRVHAAVAAIAQHEGVRAIDLLPAFDGVNPRDLWVSPGDAHPNAAGHDIIARAIYEAMQSDKARQRDATAPATTEERND